MTLVSPLSPDKPYVHLLKKRHSLTFSNVPSDFINVYVDRLSSIVVQIRADNLSQPNSCIYNVSFFSCPFSYTNMTKKSLQITYVLSERHLLAKLCSSLCRIIASDTANNNVTYQRIDLVVDECDKGYAVWNNPTIVSSSVSVLFCVCDELGAGRRRCEQR